MYSWCNVLETASILALSEGYWIFLDISSQIVLEMLCNKLKY